MDIQKRNALIGQFVLVAQEQGKIIPKNPAHFPEDFTVALSALVENFGHDSQTQGFLINELDELTARKPAVMVREVLRSVISQASTRKQWHQLDSEEAQGFDQLDARLSLLWKHMLLTDEQTPMIEKAKECRYAQALTFSRHLQEQALDAHKQADGFRVHSLQPW